MADGTALLALGSTAVAAAVAVAGCEAVKPSTLRIWLASSALLGPEALAKGSALAFFCFFFFGFPLSSLGYNTLHLTTCSIACVACVGQQQIACTSTEHAYRLQHPVQMTWLSQQNSKKTLQKEKTSKETILTL